MDYATFAPLALACAPLVHPVTAYALVRAESEFNPNAVGVVQGTLTRQPRSAAEAMTVTRALSKQGFDFSVGLGQINQRNFARLGLDVTSALDPCRNLAAMQTVLLECHSRTPHRTNAQPAVREALSCYYSGNFVTGFQHGYVQRVLRFAPHPAPTATSRR